YEIPYVIQTSPGQPRQTGWSNAFPGLKWRFYDEGEGGWQLSLFPQMEANAPTSSLQKGIAGLGSRLLLPFEATKRLGPVDVDFEAGYYLPKQGESERILGLVVGRSMTERFDLGVELYNDRATGGSPNETTLDLGGRYKLSRGRSAGIHRLFRHSNTPERLRALARKRARRPRAYCRQSLPGKAPTLR